MVWIVTNWIAIVVATLASFRLHVELDVNHYSGRADWYDLLSNLITIGVVQGLIVAGLQTAALLVLRFKVSGWFATTSLAVLGGMVGPAAIGLATSGGELPALDPYILAGWFFSWVLMGLAQGILVGNRRRSRRWSLILQNTGAGFCSVAAIFVGVSLLITCLETISIRQPEVLISSGLISLFLLTGAGLNTSVLLMGFRNNQ